MARFGGGERTCRHSPSFTLLALKSLKTHTLEDGAADVQLGCIRIRLHIEPFRIREAIHAIKNH